MKLHLQGFSFAHALWLLVSAVGLTMAQSASEIEWRRLSGSVVSFSVDAPADDWIPRLVYSNPDALEDQILEQAELIGPTGARIAVEVWRDGTNGSITNWWDANSRTIGTVPDQLTDGFVGRQRVPAMLTEVRSEFDHTYDMRTAAFRRDSLVFRVTYLDADHGASASIFQHILDSFDFDRTGSENFSHWEGEKGDLPILVYECAGHYDDCLCGAYNPYPCCSSPQGNCTWWAWDRACCVWNDDLLNGVSWGNATSWAGYATSHGYTVSMTPAVNTIACNSNAAGGLGHVAWVVQVSGSQVQVTEMGWCLWGTVRTTWYNTSYFDQGFIYPMGSGSSITLISPNGGENLCVNQQTTVQWSSSGISGNVRLRLYQGGTSEGNALGWIGTNLANTGSYPWTPGTDLTTNCNYYVKVEDQAQTVYDFSNAAFCVTDPTDQTPSISATDDRCDNVQLTWTNVNGESGYYIYRNGIQRGSVGANVTNYSDDTASPGVTYSYTVAAWNTCGTGSQSNQDTGIRLATPSQVTGVSATENNCNNVVVTWTDQSGESGYYIYRNGIQRGSVGANVTNYSDDTASPGVTYSYTVAAWNTCGTGSQSSQDTGIRLATPSQVTGVSATENNCNNVVVTWTDQSGESGYYIYRNGSQIGSAGANVTNYTDNTASPGVTYNYSVAANNACGTGSQSNPDNGTRLATPSQVTGVSATENNCNNVVVTWTDQSGESGYYVYRNGSQIGSAGANVTNYTDNTASQGVTYNYSVAANNTCGTGSQSIADAGTRLATPGQVNGVAATDNLCNSIVITWTDAAGETGYTVYRTPGGSWTVGTNVISYTDNTASPGVTYSYEVAATNSCGTGPVSVSDNGTLLAPSAAPANCAASESDCNGITVTWTDNSGDETGFRVFRDSQQIAQVSAGQTTYLDEAASPGNHAYFVRSYNACGESSSSNSDNGSVGLPPDAAPGDCQASDFSCANIAVTWEDLSFNEDGFFIFRDGGVVGNVPSGETTFEDDPAPGTYTYWVRAYNTCGNSGDSNTDTGTRSQSAAAPSNCAASDSICESILITWTDNSPYEMQFRVYRDGVETAALSANTTSYEDTPSPGNHVYRVAAYTICGLSDFSNDDTGTRLTTPNMPTNFLATDGLCNVVNLSWTDATNEIGYLIRRDGIQIGAVGANVTSFQDMPSSGTYSYTVTAFNLCGNSSPSAPDQGSSLPGATPPSNCQASDTSCSGIFVTWQDNSNNESGFRIYRDGNLAGQVGANVTFFYTAPPIGTYNYSVSAYTAACGNSEPCTDWGTRQTMPNSPTSLSASDTSATGILLTWQDASTNETGFVIYRDLVIVHTTAPGVTTYTDHPADYDSHEYCVAALNNCGQSNSVCDFGQVVAGLPAPEELVLEYEMGWLWLNWHGARDTEGDLIPNVLYDLYRSSDADFVPAPANLYASTQDTVYVDWVDPQSDKWFYVVISSVTP